MRRSVLGAITRKVPRLSVRYRARLAVVVSLDSKFARRHVVDRALELERAGAPRDSRVAVSGARLDPELWAADVGPWGGYVAALLTKAIGEAVPELPAVSLTVHFLSRLRVGAFRSSRATGS